MNPGFQTPHRASSHCGPMLAAWNAGETTDTPAISLGPTATARPAPGSRRHGRSARACRGGRSPRAAGSACSRGSRARRRAASVVHGSVIVKRMPVRAVGFEHARLAALDALAADQHAPRRSRRRRGARLRASAGRCRRWCRCGTGAPRRTRAARPSAPSELRPRQRSSRCHAGCATTPASIGSNQRSRPPCSALYSSGCQCARCGTCATAVAVDDEAGVATPAVAAAVAQVGVERQVVPRRPQRVELGARGADASRAAGRRQDGVAAARRAPLRAPSAEQSPGALGAALAHPAAALPRQRRALAQRRQLGLGDLAPHRRQAAVGAGEEPLRRHEAQRAADRRRRPPRASRSRRRRRR